MSVLKAAAAGTVTVTATIKNGFSPSDDYTQDFDIVFTDGGKPSTAVRLPNYNLFRPFTYIKVKEARPWANI